VTRLGWLLRLLTRWLNPNRTGCACPTYEAPKGALCHCGAPAEWRSPFNGADWCMSCKYAAHPDCFCSNQEVHR
jgi:hypothetical protein